jgi:hypothetical protein
MNRRDLLKNLIGLATVASALDPTRARPNGPHATLGRSLRGVPIFHPIGEATPGKLPAFAGHLFPIKEGQSGFWYGNGEVPASGLRGPSGFDGKSLVVAHIQRGEGLGFQRQPGVLVDIAPGGPWDRGPFHVLVLDPEDPEMFL